MKLKITSSMEYLWRVTVCGATHNDVKCFHVFDEQGKMLAGGYNSGSNVQSGSPVFARKMDAVAFADGYTDYLSGVESLTYTDKAGVIWPSRDAGDRYVKTTAPKTSYTEQVASAYISGVYCAVCNTTHISGAYYKRASARGHV